MPNWCENLLYVQGDRIEIERFIKFAKAKDMDTNEDNKNQMIDFNNFVPYPKELEDKDRLKWLKHRIQQCKNEKELEVLRKEEKISDIDMKEIMLLQLESEDDYDIGSGILGWHTAYWGTKWNANFYDSMFRDMGDVIEYHFDTAWGPSIPVTIAMAKQFKTLTFTHLYYEPGMDFSGFVRVNNEDVIDSAHNKVKKNWDCPKMKMKKWKLNKVYEVLDVAKN